MAGPAGQPKSGVVLPLRPYAQASLGKERIAPKCVGPVALPSRASQRHSSPHRRDLAHKVGSVLFFPFIFAFVLLATLFYISSFAAARLMDPATYKTYLQRDT